MASWQGRLSLLGVSHWEVEDVTIEDDEDNNAGVRVSGAYDSCSFYFTPVFLAEASDSALDNVIVHEWVHVAMRDLDKAIEAGSYEIPIGSRHQWDLRVFHEREGFVDQIARQLVEFYTN